MVDTPWFYLLISRAEFVHIVFFGSICVHSTLTGAGSVFVPSAVISLRPCIFATYTSLAKLIAIHRGKHRKSV